MPRVGVPDWRDILADETNELETLSRLGDAQAIAQARNMLRVLRSYETRVRQIALKPDPYGRDAHLRVALPPRRW